MRLLVVTNDYPPKPGGIQQYLGTLLDHFAGDLLVVAPRDGPASETRRGEEIVTRNERSFMLPTPAVAQWVADVGRRFGPDAILFGAPHPLSRIGPQLRSDLGAPFAVLCHGAEITIPAALPGLRQPLSRWLRRADVLFAVSRFTARRVSSLTGRPVRYLGAGVDLATFHPAGVSQGGRTVVGCVSRFVPRKGQHRLLHAVADLRRRSHDIEVLLVGKGRTETSLRRLADRLDVPTRFEVDVPWARLPALYREMDVFCMPCRSRWAGLEIEGLGLVFLEAAASGLPVIAGDSGGAPETVQPGVTGFVATSPRDIGAAIERIVTLPDRGAAMGAAGRRLVEDEFTWPNVVARFEAGFQARL